MKTAYSQARIARDRNFDGTFFFGVSTTGIFCRPSCPSPTANEKNVHYFDTMFEALNEGFRPCLRCRPDVSVEYCNGNIDGVDTVNSALKMIYDGYLNYHSIRELAQELELSDRHLRQLFIDNLGVPPVKIAQYHKCLFAKKLLTSSGQAITDIAFASGFGSIRQFNDAFKSVYGKTPTAIRNALDIDLNAQNNTTLLLRYDDSFNFTQTLGFMSPRSMAGVELITADSYSRTFRTRNTQGYFTVTDNPRESCLELRIVCDDIKCFMEVHNRVRRMFDLDTNFTNINAHFAKDPLLSQGMINGHVPRLPVAFEPFEFSVRAVLGQQISVKAATTLAARIAEKARLETNQNFPDGLDYFFPNAEELLELDLEGLGLTNTRQATVKTVAQAVFDGAVKLTANQSFDTFHRDFVALKGIGDWTANYVGMRGLGMIDSFPASDLGVIKALTKGDKKPSQKEILKAAEKWQPYRAYATLCLWNRQQEER